MIRINNSLIGTIPAKAIGKKSRESALSPTKVETIARNENLFPLLAIFILLIIYAFKNEPIKNAIKLAIAIRGVAVKIDTNADCPSQNLAEGSKIAN